MQSAPGRAQKNKAGNNSLPCRLQPAQTYCLAGAAASGFLVSALTFLCFFADLAGLASAGAAASAATAGYVTAGNTAAIRGGITFFMPIFSLGKDFRGVPKCCV